MAGRRFNKPQRHVEEIDAANAGPFSLQEIRDVQHFDVFRSRFL